MRDKKIITGILFANPGHGRTTAREGKEGLMQRLTRPAGNLPAVKIDRYIAA